MDTILNAPFMVELINTCTNMYRLGWNERNGGNISMRIDEVDLKPYLDFQPLRRIDLRFDAKPLAGIIFAVTGTGKYFKNVEYDPALNLGIIRIRPDGTNADVLWGFSDGGRPTSELPSHLRSHIARLSKDSEHRVVMHCHSTNTLAMTYVHPLDDKQFTRTLWQMSTECIVVFPEGIGDLPWMLCGNDEIGRATARKMEDYRLCIWAQHGIFGAGRTLDETFGLIETVEKSAEIYIKTMKGPIINTITDSELRILAEAFKVDYRKDFLE
ncbi:MAG: rhamnulose-1-phosphate aldolase [Treponema sp.]|jgi:rhamnulose-1-phosphate aldolase|nr:rhamnulose-1-phosphate aldolase [Treponema sp.]